MTNAVTCPSCAATTVQAVSIAKRDVGKALLAEALLGTAAGVVAGSSTVIVNTCLTCGAQWLPGTEAERRMRALSGQLGDSARDGEHQRLGAAAAERRKAVAIGFVLFVVIAVLAILGLVETSGSR